MRRRKIRPVKKIQKEILQTMLVLVIVMTVLISVISFFVNVHSERRGIDQNLQNVGRAVAQSEIIRKEMTQTEADSGSVAHLYLDSLKETLSNIDVISVVRADQVRVYHTNPELIGTTYDGTLPAFSDHPEGSYVTSDIGPSGSQRRAYTEIRDDSGAYIGFVLVSMLDRNIDRMVLETVWIHLLCAGLVILLSVLLSRKLSGRIKRLLHGYEPDTFSAMFSIRNTILESLEEGVLALDSSKTLLYQNAAAKSMLSTPDSPENQTEAFLSSISIAHTLSSGKKQLGVSVHLKNGADILVDQIPVLEQGKTAGLICILRDRTEYTKIMEDLSGVRYMVESMRANNHDFTNKLHVILGLIQMGNTAEASEYISRIATIQQSVIQNVVKNIEDPSVAALLIGKYARAAELNIQFKMKSGSRLSRDDIFIPSGDLVTIIGNLLDNAMDSMNEKADLPKELSVGIFTQPHAMLISVDDTGLGIPEDRQTAVFEDGVSSKGTGRGTGLFVVKRLVENYNGSISLESEPGFGTSFTITLTDEGGSAHV